MRARILAASLLIAAVIVGHGTCRGETLDRVVAVVNGHALLASDWDEELRYECFMSGRSLHDVAPEDRDKALGRLIDQELLHEQMSSNFKPASDDEINKELTSLEADYASNHDARSWSAALATYGITQATVRERVALELNQLRLVDARLRPSIQIDAAAVERYYKEQIVPKISGGQQISLQQAEPKIREILLQQKMNELLDSWLESLRSQARIQSFVPGVASSQVSMP